MPFPNNIEVKIEQLSHSPTGSLFPVEVVSVGHSDIEESQILFLVKDHTDDSIVAELNPILERNSYYYSTVDLPAGEYYAVTVITDDQNGNQQITSDYITISSEATILTPNYASLIGTGTYINQKSTDITDSYPYKVALITSDNSIFDNNTNVLVDVIDVTTNNKISSMRLDTLSNDNLQLSYVAGLPLGSFKANISSQGNTELSDFEGSKNFTIDSTDEVFITLKNLAKYKELSDTDVISKIKHLPQFYENPSQYAGKYLATDGEQIIFVGQTVKDKITINPTKDSSTITLTGDNEVPADITNFGYLVYRNGLYLTDGVDYSFDPDENEFTFVEPFERDDEIVTIFLGYSESEVTEGYRNITLLGNSNMLDTTPATSDDSKRIANTEFVNNAIEAALMDFSAYEPGTNIVFSNNALTGKIAISATQPDTSSFLTSSDITEYEAGSNITFTNNANNGKVTIAATQPDTSSFLTSSDITEYEAGTNVTFTTNSQNGKVTISATHPDTSSFLTSSDITEYEAGTNVTFTNNANTGKVTISAQQPDVSSFITDADVTKYEAGTNITFTNNPSTGKVTIAATHPDLSSYVTSSDLQTTLGGYAETSDIPDVSSFITDADVTKYEAGTNITFTNNTSTGKVTIAATDTVTTVTNEGAGNAVTSITANNGVLTVTKGSSFAASDHDHSGTYAPLASPALTGTPTAPTATAGTNSTQIATTAYVDTAVSNLVNSAPAALDTLGELATVLGDPNNLASTVIGDLGGKLDSDSANYVKSLSISGTTITVTKGNDSTSTLTTQDTTYSDFVGSGNTAAHGLVPAPPSTAGTSKYLREDGTWETPPNDNTTYSTFIGSGATAASGLVPAPSTTAGTSKYLREDGSWETPPDHTYSNFVGSGSTAAAGLVPAPSTTAGTTKYLREDGSWETPPDHTYTNGTGITITGNVISADDQLPSQSGNSGKFLTTDGTDLSWSNPPAQYEAGTNITFTNNANTGKVTIAAQQPDVSNFVTSSDVGDAIDAALAEFEPAQGSAASKVLSSTHYPTANATIINLTAAQAPANSVSDYELNVFRNGLYLEDTVDYTYSQANKRLTFTRAFEADEIVVIKFSYMTDKEIVLNEIKYTSLHYPSANATTVVLTTDQVPSSNANGYTLAVYRNGIFMNNTIDYTYTANTRTLSFVVPFGTDEVVTVIFSELTEESSVVSGTGNGGTATLPEQLRVSSIHYPSATDTTITLTSAQKPSSNIEDFGMSVFRNGVYLNNTLDYTYNNSTGVITFTSAFTADEVVAVNFAYFDSESELNPTYLQLTGNQIMTGVIKSNSSEAFRVMNVSTSGKTITAYDSNNNELGEIEFITDSNGKRYVNIKAIDGALESGLSIVTDSTNSNVYATGPAISNVNDSSNKLATTNFVQLVADERFKNAVENVSQIYVTNDSLTINPTTASLFKASISSSISVTLSNPANKYTVNGSTISLELTITDEDAAVSWPQNVKWSGDNAPSLGYINVITFITFNGGTTWYGSCIVIDSEFPSSGN